MNSIRNPVRSIRLPQFVGEEPDLLRNKRDTTESKPFVSSLEKLKRKVNVSLPVVKLAK